MIEKLCEGFVAVTEFHRRNDQRIAETPFADTKGEDILLRVRLMLEELGELAIAVHERKRLEVADGLADLLYVFQGTLVTVGCPMADAWPRETKVRERPDLDYWPDHVDLVLSLNALCARVEQFISSLTDGSWLRVMKTAGRLMICIRTFAEIYQIPLRDCFLEVHRSNLTKYLGQATEGKKYGTEVAKGEGYIPPDHAQFFSVKEEEVFHA